MIQLVKMDNSVCFLNPMQIEQISVTPDILITLINGKKFIVKDSPDQIISKFIEFWKSVYSPEHKIKYLKDITGSK